MQPSRLEHLNRLVENSFSKIPNFLEKITVEYEKLENAKSFWSEIYLVHLKVKEDVVEEKLEIPDTVFIKIPRISENVLKCEDGSAVNELHNVLVYYSKKENLFYHHFLYDSIPNFPFPKVYFTEDITREATGGIVAENLSEKVFAVEHIPGLSHEQVLRLMEALAGFHSHLIQREDKSYVKSFEEGAHGRETYSVGMQKMMFEESLLLGTMAPEVFGNGRIQKIQWAFDYENKNKATREAVDAIPGIICHADLNVTNMLWKTQNSNSEIGAIIDFQMVLIGSVYYHEKLSGFFNGNPPYSLDDLNNQYRLIYPFASNFSLFGICVYIKLYRDGTLGKPEDVERNCDELVDRARGIVEDIEEIEADWK
ncbi:Protein CBG11656 [Caenorhabditis briggsae]|uniref:Protein CBG11656 n=1 Tax=Caenorhabditis briggsae TaxID=6238 RepID=A8XDQ8_CAEBR|nr:Protein CBG11656 [Caenorhabditis briggsae]CAP30778.2 Protein CBG11656 [Caenorhabditis briggsae]